MTFNFNLYWAVTNFCVYAFSMKRSGEFRCSSIRVSSQNVSKKLTATNEIITLEKKPTPAYSLPSKQHCVGKNTCLPSKAFHGPFYFFLLL